MGTLTSEALAALAIGIGLGAAGAARFAGRRWPTSSAMVLGSSLLGGLVAVIIAAGVVLREPDMFLLAHLLYLVGVISVPVAGLGLALVWRRLRPQRVLAVGAVLLVIPAPIGIYATHVAPYRLREDHVQLEVAAERAPADRLRIGVLSDLQLVAVGDHERAAIERIMAQRPDLILIAGDLYQGPPDEFAAALDDYRALLGTLEAPAGVFVVRGDVDARSGEVEALTDGTDIEILDDEIVRTEVDGQAISVGGVQLDWEAPAAQQVLDDLQEVPEDELSILLAHRPDAVLDLPASARVDLTVAGHTHGGQIAIPGFGPIETLTSVPRAVASGGLHEVAGNAIYVSSGIGMERGEAPQLRLFTRPSYGIVDVAGPAGPR